MKTAYKKVFPYAKRAIILSLSFALVVPLTFFINPNVAHAATVVTDTFSIAGYTTWTAPAGIGANADIACWGAGGAGFTGDANGGGSGGGGGAFASSTISVTQGDVIRLFVGAGGATSGANGATSTASTTGAVLVVSAAPGWGGKSQITLKGLGGAVASSTGTTKFAGGNGGVGANDSGNADQGGGGGGAGGPHAAGNNGSDSTPSSGLGGNGGQGDGTSGGAGGTNVSGGNGNPGGTDTNGGGGGAGGDNGFSGGAGGTYGGGGGGGEGGFGAGAAGACTVTYSVTKPTVTTSVASSITATSATYNGDITAGSATARGFAFGTSATLTTVTSTSTSSGSFGVSSFTLATSSLSAGTTYYFRAYATNLDGTAYGSIQSFTTSGPTITLIGSLYSDEGQTKITSGKTIKASVNGTTPASATSDGSGNFSINIDIPSLNNPIAIWVDGDSSTRAFTLTKATSTVAIGSIPLYQNRVTLINQSTTTITTNELGTYDSSDDSDIQFSVTSAGLVTNAGQKLYIAPRTTFVATSSVTTSGNAAATPDGDFGLGEQAAYFAGATTTIAGNLLASTSANFITNGFATIFTASTTGKIISGPFIDWRSFASTTFSGSGTWTFLSNASTTNVTVSGSGTVVAPSDLTVNGNYSNAGAITAGSGTTTFASKFAVGGVDASGGVFAQNGSSAFNAVFATGTYLYVVKASNSTDCAEPNKIGCEFQIYDISSTTNPVYMGGADASGLTNSGTGANNLTTVYVAGNYAYIGKVLSPTDCSTVGNKAGCELQVYDISDPTNPTFVGGADNSGSTNAGTDSNSGFSSIFVSGNYVYVTSAADTTTCSATPGSARGCELKIFDISNPASPTYVGGADASGATNSGTNGSTIVSDFNSVFVSGSYAYIAKGGDSTDCSGGTKEGCELQVYNIATPATPTFVGGADAGGLTNSGTAALRTTSVAVGGNYAYVSMSASSTACSITASMGNGCELKIFDISTPASPTYVGGADAGGQTNAGTRSNGFLSVYVSGNYAYVGDTGSTGTCSITAGSTNGCELKVFLISTPSTPTYQGGADASALTNTGTISSSFNSVAVSGNYVFVGKAANATECPSATTKIGCELQIYDVTTKTTPTFSVGIDATVKGGAITSSAFNSVYVQGNYAYVAKAADVTDCANATNHIGCEFQIYNIANGGNPVYVGGADYGGLTNSGAASLAFNSVYVSGNYAYLAGEAVSTACSGTASDTNGCEFKIFDISNPRSPTYVAGADAAGTINSGTGSVAANSVYVSGNYAYVARATNATNCSSKTGCELQIYDVTTPAVPTYAGGADADGQTNAGTSASQAFNAVFVAGNYAYVAAAALSTACTGSAGAGNGCELKIFDVTNKTAPTYVGGADSTGTTNSGVGPSGFLAVSVSGNYAYIADGGGSSADCATVGDKSGCELKVFDIGNIGTPATPTFIGGADTSGATNSGTDSTGAKYLYLFGNYVYLTKIGGTNNCNTNSTRDGCELQVYDISSPATPTFVGGTDVSGNFGGATLGTLSNVFATNNFVYVAPSANSTDCAYISGSKVGCELQVYRMSDLLNATTTISGNTTGSSAFKNLTIDESAQASSAGSVEITGNYTNSGTFAQTATTTFSGSSQQTISGNLTAASAFANLEFSGGTKNLAWQRASTTNITISSGVVVAPLHLSVAGNYINNGTFSHNNGTMYFGGSGKAISGTLTGTSAFNNVVFNGSGTKTFLNNASTTGFTVEAGNTVVAPSLLSIAGNYSNAGVFTAGSGTVFVSESQAPVLNFLGGADADGTTNSGVSGSQYYGSTYVSGNYLYVTASASSSPCSGSAGSSNGCELKIFDISTPASPTYVGGADAGGQTNAGTMSIGAFNVYVSGNYAYVAFTGNSGTCSITAGSTNGCELKVFDISNPASPTYVGGADAGGQTNAGTTNGHLYDIYVLNGFAYIAKSGADFDDCGDASDKVGCELQVYNVSNPSTPTFVGGADASGVANSGATDSSGANYFYAVSVVGNYAYIGKAGNPNDCGGLIRDGCELQIYDISNPATPLFVAGADVSGGSNSGTAGADYTGDIYGLSVSGNYMYVAGLQDETDCSTAGNKIGCELKVYSLKANIVSGVATGTSAFNNLTVTNTSGAGGNKVSVIFQASASTTGTFTMLASTSAQFLANATSTFQNISWVGTSGSPITLRSSTSGTPWYLKVDGTQSVSYVNVKDSNACSGSTISTANSTDSGGNTCWNFNVVVDASFSGSGGGEVGGAAPDGVDVGGGSGGGGESIGSEPGFNIPALFAAAAGWLSNWLNPSNAQTQDVTYATATSFAASDFYSFGFSIPPSDAITGIAVKIVASGSTAAGTIGAEVSWNGGSATTTSATATGVLSTGDVVYTLGGPSSLFGRSWTPTEFSNANFRVRLIANPGSNTLKVDAIQVRVYHQASGGGGGGGGEI
ncbi:MAG: hypothetical protein V4436_02860 [Patescibacteria group bacterium]